MAEMTPEEMEMMQQQAGKETGGGATKLVQQVGEGLAKLSEMLMSAKGTTDQDKAQMEQIMSSFVDLVEKKLSAEPGQDAPSENPEMSQIPMDQGGGGQPMGPATRN